jgi:DHA1 family bicyclomycin/chloramphenicol resistance-like MFS transporter
MRPSQFDSPEPARVAPRRPPVLALVAISGVSPFAINSVVPSMPAIALVFEAGYDRVQLMLSLFLASMAISQIFIGPLSDRFGRRPVLLAGFAFFVAACLLSLAAPTIDALLATRIVQGATGCVGIVLSRAIVRDLFDRRQAASMLGYVTMGLAVAPMVAPMIGGLLQEFFDWTAVFAFTALFGAVCVAVTWGYVPETNLQPTPRLSFASMFNDFGKLVRDTDFLLFTASSGLGTGVFFAFLGGAPYVSEHILGLTPGVYGMWFGVAPIGYVCGNYLAGRFTERFGIARMILAGSSIALIAAALLPLLFYLGFVGAWELFLPMVLVGVANGLSLPSAISGAISVRPEIAGAASGLSGAAQMGTGAVLSAAAGAVLTGGSSAMPMFALMFVAALLAVLVALAIYPRNRP